MTRRKRQIQNLAENLRQAGDLDNVAHFEPRRETVGDLLRRARVGKNQEVAEVAARLRIRAGYLKAIEDGRFQDLPGLTYAVGFVRTYADHLGLDAEDVVRRFRDEVTELKSQTQLIFPVVAAEGKIPRGAVLLLSAVLAAIAYGGWYYLSEREQSPLDLIPALPESLQQLISDDEAPAPEALPGTTGGNAPADAASDAANGAAPATTGETAPGQAAVAPPAPAVTAPAVTAPAVTTPAPSAATTAVTPPVDPAAPAVAAPATDMTAATQQGATTPAPADGQLAAVPPAVPEATAPAPAVQAPATGPAAVPGTAATTGTAPPPAVAAPGAPAVPAPGLDSSGLPTVAAPAAPASPTIPGVTAPSDAASLPPVAEGQVFGATEGAPSRIVLVARLESWIQVTDPETNALLTRVLRAGDRYYVPDQAGLTLATGNAGGLDIWVDGGKVPTLGPVGVVRRGIVLDPTRLQTGTALTE